MKNLLFISVYPFPQDMGSKQHAYYFLKALTAQFNVHCLFFMPPNMPRPTQTEVNAIDLDLRGIHFKHFQGIPKANSVIQFFGKIVSYPNRFTNAATHPEGLSLICAIIEEHRIDIVHFEHFWFAKYALQLNGKPKKTLVYHDLHHDVYRQQIRFVETVSQKAQLYVEYLKCYVFERQLEKCLSLKVFLNPDEMRAFPDNAVCIPHIVNAQINYRPVRDTSTFNILFLGAYNHAPNRLSVKFIIDKLMPELVRIRQDVTLHIIGSGTEQFAGLLTHSACKPNVRLRGFEKDINAVFRDMDLALFPIDYGGGVKTKILDAMAAGVPVVTTPAGLTGMPRLPENCIAVGNGAEELIKHIFDLMNSFSLRDQRSRLGRSYVAAEHSFATFSEKVVRAFQSL